MAGTVVELSKHLGATVDLCSSVQEAVSRAPAALFAKAHILVIDDIPWRASLDVIRTGLDARRRQHKDPWSLAATSPEIVVELAELECEVREIFGRLYPLHKADWLRSVFRPMITGPEPIHFDTYEEDAAPRVAAFLNVSNAPRIYGVGPNLYELVERDPELVRRLWHQAQAHSNFSLHLRHRTKENRPPLDADAPRHRVGFAPGAIWFFNAKTVSHEVIRGAGAVSYHWSVPGMAELQREAIFGGA